MARAADLVLTAEVRHRDIVMTAVPAAFRRTFTMKEFARLAGHLGPGSYAEVIAEAARIRGIDGPLDEGADDMPDPYRDSVEKAKTIAQQITATVHATIGALGLWPHDHAAEMPATPALVPHRSHTSTS
jgi:protein-tyrosine phosphatase